MTPHGEIYQLVRNAGNESEFAGATFAPDGSTFFVNVFDPGLTLAITGPWEQRRGSRSGFPPPSPPG